MSNKKLSLLLAVALCVPKCIAQNATGQWSLQQCIDYALQHNVQVLKSIAQEQSKTVDVTEAKAGKLPTLSASLVQGVGYRPFQEASGSFVNGGIATSASNKTTQSGNYGVNAQWVVWNGGKTKMNITNAQFSQQLAAYDTQTSVNKLKEQVAQLYVQVQYMEEAECVNRMLLIQDSIICERGREMVLVGAMAKADLSQLESQVSQGRYEVVNIQTEIANAKKQLRQLIDLPISERFDLQPTDVDETKVLAIIPTKENIYNQALTVRSEIKSSELSVEQSRLATKIAKTAYYPTISLTGSLGDSHMTGSQQKFFSQMKNNFSTQLGISVNIPILDNRKTKSAVERAQIEENTARLDLQDAQKQLWQTVETYWLNATNSQAKYVAAKANVKSLENSYRLMTEQFNLGLKNIAELLNSRSSLLSAQQQMLQEKYTALLNRSLLEFYGGKELK